MKSHSCLVALLGILALPLAQGADQAAPAAPAPVLDAHFAIPATDDGLPGPADSSL